MYIYICLSIIHIAIFRDCLTLVNRKPHLWMTSPGIVKPHQVSGVHTAQHGSPVE